MQTSEKTKNRVSEEEGKTVYFWIDWLLLNFRLAIFRDEKKFAYNKSVETLVYVYGLMYKNCSSLGASEKKKHWRVKHS